jgi:hypothetical protein
MNFHMCADEIASNIRRQKSLLTYFDREKLDLEQLQQSDESMRLDNVANRDFDRS